MALFACPSCKAKIAFSAKVCPKCAHEVTANERARGKRLAKIGDVIGAVGLLALAGGFIGTCAASNGSWLIASGIGVVLLMAARRR